jgi:signal transduction histidine kinase
MKFSLILISAFTIGSVGALVYFFKLDSFSFAWALNFLLMFCAFAFTGGLKIQYASSYYDEKEWENKGKVYEYLGVNLFRKLLVLIGWEKVIRKATPISKSAEDLANLCHQTRKSELGHAIIFIVVLGFTIFVAFRYGIEKSIWLLTLNVIFNLYPVFLQRYNRPRILRAINIRKRR